MSVDEWMNKILWFWILGKYQYVITVLNKSEWMHFSCDVLDPLNPFPYASPRCTIFSWLTILSWKVEVVKLITFNYENSKKNFEMKKYII